MKRLMILGGGAGFLLGTSTSLARGCEPATALWRGALATLVVGLLFRWWGKQWFRHLHVARAEQLASQPKPQPKPFVFPTRNNQKA